MGDPACWSHLFYDEDGEPRDMTTTAVEAGSGQIARELTDFLSRNDERIMQELFEFLRIPSVSAKSDHNADTKRAADWVKNSLDRIGVPARVYPTAGHPVVVGEWRNAPGKPTVLIYGHYDVQPAEPLELWTTPPFEPAVRGENLYGRGTADDKGQVHIHLKALEALRQASGKLPVNVKVMIEGEEEIGSVSLWDFVQQNRARLKADALVVSDTA